MANGDNFTFFNVFYCGASLTNKQMRQLLSKIVFLITMSNTVLAIVVTFFFKLHTFSGRGGRACSRASSWSAPPWPCLHLLCHHLLCLRQCHGQRCHPFSLFFCEIFLLQFLQFLRVFLFVAFVMYSITTFSNAMLSMPSCPRVAREQLI